MHPLYHAIPTPGYAQAYDDTGLSYTVCADGAYTVSRTDIMTCAPGCKDIATDIVPYIR